MLTWTRRYYLCCSRLGITPRLVDDQRRPYFTRPAQRYGSAGRTMQYLAQALKDEDWTEALDYYNDLAASSRTQRSAERIWEALSDDRRVEWCDFCAKYVLKDDMDRHYGDRMCSDCAEQRVYTEDGRFILRDDAYEHRNGLLYSYEERTGLQNYHSHPERENRIRLHRSSPTDKLVADPFKLGIEWEYNSEDREADAKEIETMPYALAEKDGSLSWERGIEIVTGYSTLGTVCEWITEIGDTIQVDDTVGAGLHVNISGLSNCATAKLISLINSDHRQIKRVAGRYDTEYALQQNRRLAVWLSSFQRNRREDVTLDKYVHVRVRRNYTELRIFDSSDDADVIKGRVQFAWLCAHFCSQPGLDVTFDRLVKWFGENVWTHRHVPDLIAMDCGFRRSGQHKVPPKGPRKCLKPTSPALP